MNSSYKIYYLTDALAIFGCFFESCKQIFRPVLKLKRSFNKDFERVRLRGRADRLPEFFKAFHQFGR